MSKCWFREDLSFYCTIIPVTRKGSAFGLVHNQSRLKIRLQPGMHFCSNQNVQLCRHVNCDFRVSELPDPGIWGWRCSDESKSKVAPHFADAVDIAPQVNGCHFCPTSIQCHGHVDAKAVQNFQNIAARSCSLSSLWHGPCLGGGQGYFVTPHPMIHMARFFYLVPR